jgi:flagellar basal-body rod protein FlgB
MDEKSLFAGTIETAIKALDMRSRRHEVIVSNLANADTPGYKAFDLMVEDALAAQKKNSAGVELSRTNAGHLPASGQNVHGLPPRMIRIDDANNLRGDGNTVDMDREMAHLAENQLMYRSSARIIAKKLQGLKTVIQGGNR